MSEKSESVGRKEFICLMALLMAMVALAIDTVLPALSQIGEAVNVSDKNDIQFIIFTLYLGLAAGIIFFGPLSDSFGRKRAIYLGISIFVVGNIISITTDNFMVMLLGRFLQGFGGAASRLLTLAMIRDKFEGQEMGKIFSLVSSLFILVPVIAPSIGQLILFVADWRAIFGFTIVVGLIALTWLYFRLDETLAEEHRRPFSWGSVRAGVVETFKNRLTFCYMVASAMIFGSFICYLSLSQPILQIQYGLGVLFPLYFSGLAIAIGSASLLNAKLVMKFSMRVLCLVSMVVFFLSSVMFLLYIESLPGQPSLAAFIAYLFMMLFSFGIFHGNANALAVQPLGHIAGVASSVITSVQTVLAIVIAGAIGQFYNNTVQPLVIGFLVCGLLSLLVLAYVKRYPHE